MSSLDEEREEEEWVVNEVLIESACKLILAS